MKFILFVSLLCLSLFSCKKKPIIEEYNPTPLIVDVPEWIGSSIIGDMVHPDDNPLTIEGVNLGRKLFYEKKLSGDNTMSCASCHFQEKSFSDDNQFSQGISGDFGDRQAMAIVNLAWDELLFWDGRAHGLEDQAFGPVTNPVELNDTWDNVVSKIRNDIAYGPLFQKAFGSTKIDSIRITKAISQFERTMVSFNSDFDRYFYEGESSVLSTSELNGFNLFFGAAECIHCHAGPLLNDPSFRNNGLDINLTDLGLGAISNQSSDNGKFKVTTLRNIEMSAPYMHDGRFSTLEEVVEHYNSGVEGSSPNLDPEMNHFVGGLNLTATEKADLVAFLKTFTDHAYLNNPDYKDPN